MKRENLDKILTSFIGKTTTNGKIIESYEVRDSVCDAGIKLTYTDHTTSILRDLDSMSRYKLPKVTKFGIIPKINIWSVSDPVYVLNPEVSEEDIMKLIRKIESDRSKVSTRKSKCLSTARINKGKFASIYSERISRATRRLKHLELRRSEVLHEIDRTISNLEDAKMYNSNETLSDHYGVYVTNYSNTTELIQSIKDKYLK